MVYNYVSGRQIVAILYEDLGVNSTGWEQNAPRWITDGLLQLGTLKALEKKTMEVTIVDNLGNIPPHCRRIDSIVYNGIPVDIVNFNGTLKNRDHSYSHCAQINSTHIEFDEKEATLVVNYRGLPIVYDTQMDIYFPLIPDSPEVKQYLAMYILRLIMIQGYKHPIFTFESRNTNTNIDGIIRIYEKLAKSKINRMSKEEREEIAKSMGSMFIDYNQNKNKDFNYNRN